MDHLLIGQECPHQLYEKYHSGAEFIIINLIHQLDLLLSRLLL